MFIHTLTFLNISKSSPTKSYLAYLISNLCCIIQYSCSHFSFKMQYMNFTSILLLCLSIFHLFQSLYLSLSLIYAIISLFRYLCRHENNFSWFSFSILNILLKLYCLSFSQLHPIFCPLEHSKVLYSLEWSLRAVYRSVQLSSYHHPLLTCPQVHFFIYLVFIRIYGRTFSVLLCNYSKKNTQQIIQACEMKDLTETMQQQHHCALKSIISSGLHCVAVRRSEASSQAWKAKWGTSTCMCLTSLSYMTQLYVYIDTSGGKLHHAKSLAFKEAYQVCQVVSVWCR